VNTTVRLSDVTDVVEPSPPDPALLEFVFVDSVDAVTKLVTEPKRMLVSAAPARARQRLRRGDVLVSTVRPALNGVAAVPPPLDGATASTVFSVLRPRPELVDERYLFHWVQTTSFIAEMGRLATGGATPTVSDLQVRATEIPAAALPDQRRLAGILDQADQLRHQRRSAISLLDELADSLLLDLLESAAPLGRLDDLVESATPGSAVKQGAGHGPLIRASDIVEGELNRATVALEPWDPASAEPDRFLVRNGDVVFCRTGSVATIAKAAVFRGEKSSYGAPLLRLRPVVANAGDFLASYLNGSPGRAALRTLGSITAKSLLSLPIPLPTPAALTEFSSRLHDIRLTKANEFLQLARLDELQSSLQFRAFNGRL
jgi:type I restriction enzyme S subunit